MNLVGFFEAVRKKKSPNGTALISCDADRLVPPRCGYGFARFVLPRAAAMFASLTWPYPGLSQVVPLGLGCLAIYLKIGSFLLLVESNESKTH